MQHSKKGRMVIHRNKFSKREMRPRCRSCNTSSEIGRETLRISCWRMSRRHWVEILRIH